MSEKTKEKRMFSNDIKELLKLKGWTQSKLADELGVHESSISLWIHGDREPIAPTKTLIRMMLEEARKQPA